MGADRKADCLATLKSRILTVRLAPGAPLDETALSTEFDISRTPLREVLQRLSGEGYVTLERNRGAVVSPMDFDVMRGFFQTAPMIYASMARLAAERATAEQVAALRAVQEEFRAAVNRNEPGEMVLHNHRLHEMVGAVADNPYLMPSLQRLLIDHTRMSQTFYRPRFEGEAGRIEAACLQHDDLIDAIEAHEPARAVEITMAHWALSRDRIELYVRPDPLPMDPAADEESRNAV